MATADFFSLFRLFVRKNFLDGEFCAALRAEMQSDTRSAATVRKSGSTYAVDPSVRNVQWVDVPAPAASAAKSRLVVAKPEIEKHFQIPLTGCQALQFLAYREGDFYRPHRDSSEEPDASATAKERRISVVVFLNSASQEPREGSYGGGELTFYGLMKSARGDSLPIPLVGEEGLLIAFPSAIVHGVAPVTYGERYTIATWFF